MTGIDISIHDGVGAEVVNQNGLSVRNDTIFTDAEGKASKKIRKATEKYLTTLADPLSRALQADETILYIATAQSPAGLFDQLTFGWYINQLTRSVLVVTNRRILHIPVNLKGKWRQQIRSLQWEDLKEGKISGAIFTRALTLRYGGGKKEKFWSIPARDGRKLKRLLTILATKGGGATLPRQEMVSLCPDSMTPLTAGAEKCTECETRFKTKSNMIRYSLLIPGGGYFYTGHPFLGAADLFGEVFLLYYTLVFALVGLGWPYPYVGPLDPVLQPGPAWVLAGIFGITLAIEKVMTIHHGRFFLRYFLPDSNPDSRSKSYAMAGTATALVIAALLWITFPEQRKPLMVVAPDLTVTKSYFGMFERTTIDREEMFIFNEEQNLPRRLGAEYGWILRLKTDRPAIQWREEIDIPARRTAGGSRTSSEPLIAAHTVSEDFEQEAEKGFILNTWLIDNTVPPGDYELRIYIDGDLVETFNFTIGN